MKKVVAFTWINPLDASMGGIERVTQRLIEGLERRGYVCLFLRHDTLRNVFIHNGVDVPSLGQFLRENEVDTLVNQNGYASTISELIEGVDWQGRYIVCHHNEPRFLQKIFGFRRLIAEVLDGGAPFGTRLAWCVRLVAYPVWKWWAAKGIARTQRLNYIACDAYVVLSQRFLVDLKALLGMTNLPRVISIPNPLSFEVDISEAIAFLKDKVVLVVARLNDAEKRVSAALDAWSKIESAGYDEWTLKIVGDGPDAQVLRDKARALGLKRAIFSGRQDPLPHYMSASIFMMTSRVEGWGLTLTEAMQTGVVPVAFDAYASLHDIVEDGETGIVVRNGDVTALAAAVMRLMSDQALRAGMANRATRVCQKYRIEAVLDQWEAVL